MLSTHIMPLCGGSVLCNMCRVTDLLTTLQHALDLTGPSMMPGGDADAYKFIEPIVTKVAAQVNTATLH